MTRDAIAQALSQNVLDPRFCITCGLLLNPDPSDQSWFWHGDQSQPEHFECRRRRDRQEK